MFSLSLSVPTLASDEGIKITTTKKKPIIIIIKRKDLAGVMSKDCKDTVQTLKTATKRDCDAKERIE